ncbi:hypothetical protein LPJ73_004107, partial [Coemansia sp. RSA 2703]
DNTDLSSDSMDGIMAEHIDVDSETDSKTDSETDSKTDSETDSKTDSEQDMQNVYEIQ